MHITIKAKDKRKKRKKKWQSMFQTNEDKIETNNHVLL